MPKRLLVMCGGKNSPHNFLIKCLRFLLFDKGKLICVECTSNYFGPNSDRRLQEIEKSAFSLSEVTNKVFKGIFGYSKTCRLTRGSRSPNALHRRQWNFLLGTILYFFWL